MIVAIVCACVVVLVWLSYRAVLVVPQGQQAVIERSGRFRRLVDAGVTVRVPLLDHVRARVDLREQVLTAPLTDRVTSGNLESWATARITYRVVDAVAALYENREWVRDLTELARAEFTRRIGDVPWPRAVRDHAGIDAAILEVLREQARPWGLAVGAVELVVEERLFDVTVLP